jgi:hypothetical protein
MRKAVMLCVLAAVGTLMPAAWAQNTILDFTGFMYESDNTPGAVGYPPSNPGDVMAAVGIIENMSLPLISNPENYQYTIYFSDLISDGEYDLGGGTYYISYQGGFVDIWADAYTGPGYTAPDYGIEPPNGTAPSTFTDGSLYLHGVFYAFWIVWYPALNAGNFEGYCNWTLGSGLGELENPNGYAFAGLLDPYVAPVPQGYDLEAVGHVTFDPTVPTELSSWGQVKNLYR